MEERPPPSLVGPSCGGQEGLDPPFRGGAGRVRSREQAVGGAEQWEDPHVQSEHSKAECPVPRRQGQGSCGHTRAGLTLPGGRAPCPREGTMWGNEPGRNMLQLAVHGQRGWKPGVVPRRPCSPACRPHGGILWDRSCSPSEARPAWQVCGGDGWTGSRARSVCAYGTPLHGDTCVLGPDSPGLTDPQEHPAKARQRPITFDRGDPGAVEG